MAVQNTISLKDYHQALIKADWFYSYSDDYEVRQRASENIEKLRRIGKTHPVAKKMLKDVDRWVAKLWNDSGATPPQCPQIHMHFKF